MTTNKMPAYMRSSVSPQFLAKNPNLKPYFQKCPACGKFSLKPVQVIHSLADLRKVMMDRKCTQCGYTLKVNKIELGEVKKANEIE